MHLPGASLRHMVCCIESYLMHAHLGNASRIHWQLYGNPIFKFILLPDLLLSHKSPVFQLSHKKSIGFFLSAWSQTSHICLSLGPRGRRREGERESKHQFFSLQFLGHSFTNNREIFSLLRALDICLPAVASLSQI